MASILAAGAGAGEGLDDVLKRMMLQSGQAETTRHNQATEATASRNLDQMDQDRQAQAEERAARTRAIQTAAEHETQRGIDESNLMDDLQLHPPDLSKPAERVRTFMRLRAVTPRGENVPWEVVDPNAGKQPSPGEIKDTPNGMVRIAPDNSVTPIMSPAADPSKPNIPLKAYHPPQQPDRTLVQTGDGYRLRSDVTSDLQGGKAVPLADPGQIRTRADVAKMALPQADRVDNLADQLDKKGLFGPLMSRARQAAAKAGTMDEFTQAFGADSANANDPLIGEFASTLPAFASIAAQAHYGGNAGRSPAVLNEFRQMLSDSGSIAMFHGRIKGMRNALTDYTKSPSGGAFGGKPEESKPEGIRYDMNGKRIGGGDD